MAAPRDDGLARNDGNRVRTTEYMARTVEPLITELVQNLYTSKTISCAADVPAAMLSYLRRRRLPAIGGISGILQSPARARHSARRDARETELGHLSLGGGKSGKGGGGHFSLPSSVPGTGGNVSVSGGVGWGASGGGGGGGGGLGGISDAPSDGWLKDVSVAERSAARRAAMRELKPLLCELCKEACASQPEDLVGFFVNALERRPVFLSPLYHMERVGAVGGSMGSFEPPPDRASFDELVADVRARLVAPVDQSQFKVDHAFHNAKVERLELPAWWLPEDKWELVWFDDFNYVGLPDPRRWGFQTSCNRWVHDSTHQELQHYTAGRKENAWVQDGVLRITACRERLGGCDYTHTQHKGDWLYGRVDICAKLPPCKRGLWPALWLLPTDSKYGRWPQSGEIDLMEHVGWTTPGTIYSSVHTAARNHGTRSHSQKKNCIPSAHDRFHVYSLIWREDGMDLCIDGVEVHSLGKGDTGKKGDAPWRDWPFDQRFFLLINLAVGGKWGGLHGVDESAFPVSLEIAYVRVYQQRQHKASNGQPKAA